MWSFVWMLPVFAEEAEERDVAIADHVCAGMGCMLTSPTSVSLSQSVPADFLFVVLVKEPQDSILVSRGLATLL